MSIVLGFVEGFFQIEPEKLFQYFTQKSNVKSY